MNPYLLSIAIPTYNRAGILDNCLAHLLKQVDEYSDIIQVVISDNCSADNTREVIQKYVSQYPKIQFTVFFQAENTQHFGNYKKVRELSTGEYFWILSDDDYANEGLIGRIIPELKKKKAGIVFLDCFNMTNQTLYGNTDMLIENQKNYITLLSSSIIINQKENDEYLYKRFNQSAFLCFAFVVDTARVSKAVTILGGNLLKVKHDSFHSFNAFKAFIEEIMDCVGYMRELKFAKPKNVNLLVNSVFVNTTLSFYKSIKYRNTINDNNDYGRLSIIKKRIIRYFWPYRSFWSYGIVFLLLPRWMFFLIKKKRLSNKNQ